MKTRIFAVTLAVWVVAGGISLAADPMIGTWKLSEKKSKLGHGMGKNNTVVYTKGMIGNVKVTIDGTDAAGKPTHDEWSGRFDGKDHPVTGDPMSDMRSYAKINDHTMNFTAKKGGKVMISGQIVVAPDGKSRTVTAHGTTPKGKKFTTTAVYDKQ